MPSWILASTLNRAASSTTRPHIYTTSINSLVPRYTLYLHLHGRTITSDAKDAFSFRRVRPRSRRKHKRSRGSPTKVLVEALGFTNSQHAAPQQRKSVVDLSYIDPLKRDPEHFREHLRRHYQQDSHRTSIQPLRLQTILATYIRRRSLAVPSLEILKASHTSYQSGSVSTMQVFSKEENALLASRGYGLTDVEVWHSIIMDKDTGSAAEKLLLHGGADHRLPYGSSKPDKQIPTFVFLFLLRRENIDPPALRLLLVYAWQQFYRKRSRQLFKAGRGNHWEYSYHPALAKFPTMNGSSVLLMIVRLIRQARKNWSQAVVTIAKMFNQYVGHVTENLGSKRSTTKREIVLSRITAVCNRILSLLSLPAGISPFHVIVCVQRAQFDVLRTMAEHDPPLIITREGYRAIASVQLANRKTDREKDWAKLKAKSWPPWKEDKIGLDAEKGPEYGISRALEVVRRSQEAGYGLEVWERAASLLAGWDTDHSPTIQTRALLLHDRVSAGKVMFTAKDHEIFSSSRPYHDHHSIWTARIRATRTVEEAWACFLAHEDRGLSPSHDVYLAMLEKLSSEDERQRHEKYSCSLKSSRFGAEHVLAGDSKEVLPTPASPKETTYVQTTPPTLEHLAERMWAAERRSKKRFVPPSNCIIFLITHANTLAMGLKCMRWAAQHDVRVASLFSASPEVENQIHNVPTAIFSAFVKMLCRFPSAEISKPDQQDLWKHAGRDVVQFTKGHQYPLAFAYRLLKARQPIHRPAWHAVLSALAKEKLPFQGGTSDTSIPLLIMRRFPLMKTIRKQMREVGLLPDIETFRLMSKGLEHAVRTAEEVLMQESSFFHDPGNSTHVRSPMILDMAKDILSDSNQAYITQQFYEVMGCSPAESSRTTDVPVQPVDVAFPRLLAIPFGPPLHAFARVLGLLRHWQGMLHFVQWMVEYRDEIELAVKMPSNGPAMLRRTLVAMRAALEGRWAGADLGAVQDKSRQAKTKSKNQLMATAKPDQAEPTAPPGTIEEIRELIKSVEAWGGWPSDEEVQEYVLRERGFARQSHNE